jgi:hypothetical protein
MDILKLVCDGLSHTKHKWLLVLDNADDLALCKSGDSRATIVRKGRRTPASIKRFIPCPTNGSILITTRDRAVARELAKPEEIISVNNMGLNEALRLWNVKHHGKTSQRHYQRLVNELLTRLEFNPLAICQAAAYINSDPDVVTVQTYLAIFKRMDGDTLTLLNTEPNQFGGDPQASRAILKAWKRSVKQSCADFPMSINVLELMSCYDQHGVIPKSLLQPCWQIFPDANETLVDNALRRLEDQFYVNKPHCQTYKLPTLVYLGVQKWLLERKGLEDRRTDAMWILAGVFPHEDSLDLAKASVYFPHVVTVLGIAEESHDLDYQSFCTFQPRSDQRRWALLLKNISWYLERERMPARAICAARKAVLILESHPRASEEDRIVGFVNLARRLHRNGQLNEAEKFARKAYKRAKDELGKHHHLTLRCAQEHSEIEDSQQSSERSDDRSRPVASSRDGEHVENGIELVEYCQILLPAQAHASLPTVDEFEQPGAKTIRGGSSRFQHVEVPAPASHHAVRTLTRSGRARAPLRDQPSYFSLLNNFTPRNHDRSSMISELEYNHDDQMEYSPERNRRNQVDDPERHFPGQGRFQLGDRRGISHYEGHRRRKRHRTEPDATGERIGCVGFLGVLWYWCCEDD